jgi:hypothetical protein
LEQPAPPVPDDELPHATASAIAIDDMRRATGLAKDVFIGFLIITNVIDRSRACGAAASPRANVAT